MDVVDNPYSPGAGLRPAVFAGRQPEITAFDALLRRGELGRAARGMMFIGLRGVGKTVLLNELATTADHRDWIVAQLEVRSDGAKPMLTTLAAQLVAGLRQKQGAKPGTYVKRALAAVKAFSITVDLGGGVAATLDLDIPAAGSGDLEVDFAAAANEVGKAARELGTGVAVFIDELQELDKRSMAAVSAAAHAAGQRNVPFFILGAGLPNLPGKLAEAKSYSERLFDYRPLERLAPRPGSRGPGGAVR